MPTEGTLFAKNIRRWNYDARLARAAGLIWVGSAGTADVTCTRHAGNTRLSAGKGLGSATTREMCEAIRSSEVDEPSWSMLLLDHVTIFVMHGNAQFRRRPGDGDSSPFVKKPLNLPPTSKFQCTESTIGKHATIRRDFQ